MQMDQMKRKNKAFKLFRAKLWALKVISLRRSQLHPWVHPSSRTWKRRIISLWNPYFIPVSFEQNFPDGFHLEGAQISQVGTSRMRSLFLNAGATWPLCYLAPQTSSTVTSHERAYIPYIDIKFALTKLIHNIFQSEIDFVPFNDKIIYSWWEWIQKLFETGK